MDIRRGRPKRQEQREKLITRSVRLTPEESHMLDTLRLTRGKSRSDILREALRSEYESYRKLQSDDEFEYYDYEDYDDFE